VGGKKRGPRNQGSFKKGKFEEKKKFSLLLNSKLGKKILRKGAHPLYKRQSQSEKGSNGKGEKKNNS